MRKTFLLLLMMIVATAAFSQMRDPVKWSFSSKKINATTYEVRLTAMLEDEWHIYSQTTPDGGPVPTAISFKKNPLVTPTGVVKEVGKLETHFEELLGVQVKQFSDKVEFVQTVTSKPGVKTSISGSVEYMTCNDHECMPPKSVPFTITLQ